MQRSGTETYSDPERFQARLISRGPLAFTGPGPFKARQTWINLKHLRLLQVEETLPRIAFLSLPSDCTHISFAFNPTFDSVFGGVILRAGEIILHGRGQGAHDRTMGPHCWGLMSIESRFLAAYAREVAAKHIASPEVSQIMRPSRPIAMRLIRLHREACRLAAIKPAFFSHSEVARALENELLEALGNCLAPIEHDGSLAARAKKLRAMTEFEAILSAQIAQPFTVPIISRAIGLAERTLRAHCAEILGMSPNQYIRLRRLNLIRAALQRADQGDTSVEAVARHYQFGEPGRFAVTYRELFGESPSATLNRPASKSCEGRFLPKVHSRLSRAVADVG